MIAERKWDRLVVQQPYTRLPKRLVQYSEGRSVADHDPVRRQKNSGCDALVDVILARPPPDASAEPVHGVWDEVDQEDAVELQTLQPRRTIVSRAESSLPVQRLDNRAEQVVISGNGRRVEEA